MQRLSAAQLESQTVLELPERKLLNGLIMISAGASIEVSVLETLLNDSFKHWQISVLNNNSVSITVEETLTQSQLDVFCNEAVTVLSAQCQAQVT